MEMSTDNDVATEEAEVEAEAEAEAVSTVTYEQLADLETEFDDVDLQLREWWKSNKRSIPILFLYFFKKILRVLWCTQLPLLFHIVSSF